MSDFQRFHARSLRGEDVALADYAGKLALVVNTASKCGFTPQYAGLEKLYRTYGGQGFVILGFPCNQFSHQEPGDAATIENGCLITYGASFPMFAKIDVKGPQAHPLLFRWLTTALPGRLGASVKWNFTKFLVGADGTPLRRFAPITRPEKLDGVIQQALGA